MALFMAFIAVLDQVDVSDLALQAKSGIITNVGALNTIAYRHIHFALQSYKKNYAYV